MILLSLFFTLASFDPRLPHYESFVSRNELPVLPVKEKEDFSGALVALAPLVRIESVKSSEGFSPMVTSWPSVPTQTVEPSRENHVPYDTVDPGASPKTAAHKEKRGRGFHLQKIAEEVD